MAHLNETSNCDSPSASIDAERQGQTTGVELVCPPCTTDRKLVFRIDTHVVPCLCLMYILAFLDRVNIANANIFGLSEELKLDGTKYNVALLIFFVPYILFEIPSNILLKRFRPNVWLSMNMFGFGLITLLQGFVTSYSGLVATRFFLGVFEAGIFPGAFYLIGMWYRRHEAQRRYSFFFNSSTLAGAFGGLLAAAIGKLEGVRGYMGWRWIFIIEGGVTVFASLIFFFLLPGFPEQAKWLNREERAYVTARLQADQGVSGAERKTTFRDVVNIFKDFKIILGGFMYLGLVVPGYSYAYFSPIIIRTYGYSPIQTQLHSVPPWAAAFAFSMAFAYLSDKTRHRVGFVISSICVLILGLSILIATHDNTSVQYAALFLVVMGCYTAMPIVACWFNMNLGGHHRRAIGGAWLVSFGSFGGFVAVFSFLKKDAPRYVSGYSICLGFATMSIVAAVGYGISCWAANRERANNSQSAELTVEEQMDLGDLAPTYRYLL
ncbi:major facilitator superfamily domain-containing protein [Dactylonectria macrodidyma]|uniref:Major facilitator superfamily domain-containing protein n=1 Tax=Dactylonectria macrodidyma TaxID=307937 RepID=A0A9P9FMN4_9HYPO|nr:major facilitator superfamily domain-containing protein [Dactylonectria macrodidyma]